MDTKENATETIVPAIAPEGTTAPVLDDAEARYQALEAEKENYRKAYLKEANRNKEREEEPEANEESKMEAAARKVLAESRLADIAREQQAIIEKTLKENRELKLAHLNKKEPPAALGTHSETTPVRDGTITPEQMAAFKARGWTDKDIARYKQNLSKRI